jgi:hypothetical protein
MAQCDHCRNEYAACFDVIMDGETLTFDCFECAIHTLAPECFHCSCKIIGHGIQSGERIYCCAHCAREEGVEGARDHVRPV